MYDWAVLQNLHISTAPMSGFSQLQSDTLSSIDFMPQQLGT